MARSHFGQGLADLLCCPRLPGSLSRLAEVYGRLGGADSDPVADKLFLASGKFDNDRVLEHSLIYAAIESGNIEAAVLALGLGGPKVRRAGLIVLDAIEGGKAAQQETTKLLSSDEPILREAALDIAARHAEWADELAAQFAEEFVDISELVERQPMFPDIYRLSVYAADVAIRMSKFTANDRFQDALADAASNDQFADLARRTALVAMARSRLSQIPDSWTNVVEKLLSKHQLVADSVEVLRPQFVEAAGGSAPRSSCDPWRAIRRSRSNCASEHTTLSAAKSALSQLKTSISFDRD